MRISYRLLLLQLVTYAACATADRSRSATVSEERPAWRETLLEEVKAITPFIESAWVREFVGGVERLPRLEKRVIYRSPDRSRAITEADFLLLKEAGRESWKRLEFDEELVFVGRFGTPLAYARALDLAAKAGLDGLRDRRVLDFGFGAPGHLVLMAAQGAVAAGVDPDPALSLVLGDFPRNIAGGGKVILHFGRFPAQPEIRRSIGRGYHLFISKNVLKRGYIHPARPAPAWQLIELGVDDAGFAQAVFEILEPGGLAVIYNIYPAQVPPEKGYLPWADGQTALEQQVWQRAGFEVLVFDQDDTQFARRMARAFGWDRGEEAMDLENYLFAIYTILRKPGGKRISFTAKDFRRYPGACRSPDVR